MKKIILSLSLAFTFATAFAQDKAEIEKQNWFHQDFQTTGVYGIGTDAAIEFLKSKNIKPTTVVVGVLDSGIEIDHEDLKANIWVNPKEKAGNGKDDDKNGYIDDVNGWDFCADDKGVDYNEDSYEATRVVVKYTPLFNSGNKKTNLANIQKMPNEYQTYLKARKVWSEKFYAAKNSTGKVEEERTQVMAFLNELKGYAKDVKLTAENVEKLPTATDTDKESKEKINFIIANNPEFVGLSMIEIITKANEEFDASIKNFDGDLKYAYNTTFDPTNGRTSDAKIGYGNNEVEGPDAFHGSHVGGIIGATRNNGKGMNGVAGDVVKLMSVRMVPDGDERDMDVANAIRYAVDNGAKVLNMSFGKAFSPERELVYEAIRYADSKGVLMFHAAGNDNKDLDYNTNYPSNFKDNEMTSIAKNWITVGASTRYKETLKASFSNFGTAKVDIYAPGTEIYSTIPDQKYQYAQGTSMASPVAAGAAALIWAYFPNMTSQQVKEVLFETVNVSDAMVNVGSEGDERKFSDLSVTGGVIDVNKAVRLAYERYGKK